MANSTKATNVLKRAGSSSTVVLRRTPRVKPGRAVVIKNRDSLAMSRRSFAYLNTPMGAAATL